MFKFSKYTAFGNVYIVIDPNDEQINFNIKPTEEDKKKIQEICNLFFGIGSDGIIFGPIKSKKTIEQILKNSNENLIKTYNLKEKEEDIYFCRIFNPDGSEAEKSGNGTRIFAQYLIDKKYVKEDNFKILTIGGQVGIEVIDKENNIIRSDIGEASFKKENIGIAASERNDFNEEVILQKDFKFTLQDIPEERINAVKNNSFFNNFTDFTLKINCVSMGNPHCVIILDEASEEMCKKFGCFIENNSLFKNRINVQFVKILERNRVQIFIWERGAGYTMSSGTSTGAVASVCYKLGLCDKNMQIVTQGGNISVEIKDENNTRESFKVSIEGSTNLIEEGVCYI